jgi:Nucleotidyl transferase AbiEii toxin, Type IV TA system
VNLASEEAPATTTLREMLQEAASRDLGDWFVCTVGAPMMDLDAAPYGGARYPIECGMDGRTFAKFHLDIGIGDVLIPPLQKIQGQDWLGFAEIPAAEMRLISKEQQVAEKLHAYSLPRSSPNSRVKDLVDLLLLVRTGEVRQTQLAAAVGVTLDRRKTHAIPSALGPPPESWEKQFRALATECGIASGMEDSFREVEGFLAQVLHPAKAK